MFQIHDMRGTLQEVTRIVQSKSVMHKGTGKKYFKTSTVIFFMCGRIMSDDISLYFPKS